MLGICLGSQAIALYSEMKNYLPENYDINDMMKIYVKLKKESNNQLLPELPSGNMHLHEVTKYNIDTARHTIAIADNTILKSIFNSNEANVVSLHYHDYRTVGKNFIISAVAPDGVKEAVEYDNKDYFILGVHFHTELEEASPILRRLVREYQKRKNV